MNGNVRVLVERFFAWFITNGHTTMFKLVLLVINQGPDMAFASSTNVSTSWGDLSDVSVNLQKSKGGKKVKCLPLCFTCILFLIHCKRQLTTRYIFLVY